MNVNEWGSCPRRNRTHVQNNHDWRCRNRQKFPPQPLHSGRVWCRLPSDYRYPHCNQGLEFNSKLVQVDQNFRVRLQIWDTAGQESFRAIVRSFYRNSAAIVLVYSIIKYILSNIVANLSTPSKNGFMNQRKVPQTMLFMSLWALILTWKKKDKSVPNKWNNSWKNKEFRCSSRLQQNQLKMWTKLSMRLPNRSSSWSCRRRTKAEKKEIKWDWKHKNLNLVVSAVELYF